MLLEVTDGFSLLNLSQLEKTVWILAAPSSSPGRGALWASLLIAEQPADVSSTSSSRVSTLHGDWGEASRMQIAVINPRNTEQAPDWPKLSLFTVIYNMKYFYSTSGNSPKCQNSFKYLEMENVYSGRYWSLKQSLHFSINFALLLHQSARSLCGCSFRMKIKTPGTQCFFFMYCQFWSWKSLAQLTLANFDFFYPTKTMILCII